MKGLILYIEFFRVILEFLGIIFIYDLILKTFIRKNTRTFHEHFKKNTPPHVPYVSFANIANNYLTRYWWWRFCPKFIQNDIRGRFSNLDLSVNLGGK